MTDELKREFQRIYQREYHREWERRNKEKRKQYKINQAIREVVSEVGQENINLSEEQLIEMAKRRLLDKRNEYSKRHPEIIEKQRLRTYANFLRKHGYFVSEAGRETGTWIKKDHGRWQECSACGVPVRVSSVYWCKASEDRNFNFCPHCGVVMSEAL